LKLRSAEPTKLSEMLQVPKYFLISKSLDFAENAQSAKLRHERAELAHLAHLAEFAKHANTAICGLLNLAGPAEKLPNCRKFPATQVARTLFVPQRAKCKTASVCRMLQSSKMLQSTKIVPEVPICESARAQSIPYPRWVQVPCSKY